MRRREGYEVRNSGDGPELVVTGPWTDAAERRLRRGDVTGLVLNYAKGFQERSLDFVRGLPITRLDILARTIGDLSAVEAIGTQLTHLSLQTDGRHVLDLEAFPSVRSLACDWSQLPADPVFPSSLRELFVLSYASPDLQALSSASSLEALRLKDRPRIESVDGIDRLPWLRHLGLSGASRLRDISALDGPVLTTLELPACAAVDDYASLWRLGGLRHLDLSDAGEIGDLRFVTAMPRLESLYLYGSTTIVDGDLSPLLALRSLADLRIMSRRGYAPSVAEVRAALPLLGA